MAKRYERAEQVHRIHCWFQTAASQGMAVTPTPKQGGICSLQQCQASLHQYNKSGNYFCSFPWHSYLLWASLRVLLFPYLITEVCYHHSSHKVCTYTHIHTYICIISINTFIYPRTLGMLKPCSEISKFKELLKWSREKSQILALFFFFLGLTCSQSL